jgi:hypothetical protein
MTIEDFDLGDWLSALRLIELGVSGDDVIAVGDWEVTLRITHRGGQFVIESTSRGAQRRGLGSFSDLGSAIRFLMLDIGSAARFERRLPPLNADLADGFTVKIGPTVTQLTWASGWADLRTDRLVARTTRVFSRLIGHPLNEVATSLLDPAGEPIFVDLKVAR